MKDSEDLWTIPYVLICIASALVAMVLLSIPETAGFSQFMTSSDLDEAFFSPERMAFDFRAKKFVSSNTTNAGEVESKMESGE